MMINLTRIFILVIFFMYFSYVKNAQAQNELEAKNLSERIDDVTKKLQLKLILSAEQLSKIDSILIESIPQSISKENRKETVKLINAKIETVLTKKQQSKFAIIKSKWLDEILGSSE